MPNDHLGRRDWTNRKEKEMRSLTLYNVVRVSDGKHHHPTMGVVASGQMFLTIKMPLEIKIKRTVGSTT